MAIVNFEEFCNLKLFKNIEFGCSEHFHLTNSLVKLPGSSSTVFTHNLSELFDSLKVSRVNHSQEM